MSASKPLKVLMVEDSDDDAALVTRELRRGGYSPDIRRVETPEAFQAALDDGEFDIVIADYNLPKFDAPSAFALLRKRGDDPPFIIVSGSIGEETAVDAMRVGVNDYILKDRLARLVPAIERELREVEVRREQHMMREQLTLSDRMASIGTLAAGVAHEINNPLAALMANLEFVDAQLSRVLARAQELVGDPIALDAKLRDAVEPLREAREAADRVRHIVRDLKVFSRPDSDERGPVDVRRVLESAIRMASNEIRHRARLVRDYAPVPAVDANEARLGQVFLNLLVNAAQAIPEGAMDQNEIRVITRADEDDRVRVDVRDTGGGIPADVLPRIFDPFFTTKPVGVGTGLGLSICHRIVTGFGGVILVDSRPGGGTTFSVVLPPAPAFSAAAPLAPLVSSTGRRAKVLLVDDEQALGLALQRSIGHIHELEFMTSARDALDHIAGGARYDVILCDVMMPIMTGMDLHAALLKAAPDQAERMIFLTGGAFTPRARRFLDQISNPRLEKPFETPTLLALINDRVR